MPEQWTLHWTFAVSGSTNCSRCTKHQKCVMGELGCLVSQRVWILTFFGSLSSCCLLLLLKFFAYLTLSRTISHGLDLGCSCYWRIIFHNLSTGKKISLFFLGGHSSLFSDRILEIGILSVGHPLSSSFHWCAHGPHKF